MQKKIYDEVLHNLNGLIEQGLYNKKIYLFGYCNITIELVDLLESKKLYVTAILDNSDVKQGGCYKGVKVIYPNELERMETKGSVVLITSRFYAEMLQQLQELGYKGEVKKLINYNTYSEYSLSINTINRMKEREQHGEDLLKNINKKYCNYFKVFCPFNALGDIYVMSSYWESYEKKRQVKNVVFCVPSKILADVIHMFFDYPVEVYEQKELDSIIQAVLYKNDKESFIAHHDRPYVVKLSDVLYIKKITFEQMYCCGVYGLPNNTIPAKPRFNNIIYKNINKIPKGESVIFAPYAKSVPLIDINIWNQAVEYYVSMGYKCYTNVVGNEIPLNNTEAISPTLLEMKSVVERAGIFIGIRSGLCDVIREANAKKIALYPDYNYCDTKWKAIEIYWINQFEHNILAKENIEWKKL